MSSTQLDVPPRLRRAGHQFGYGLALAINIAFLIIVQNIVEWGWIPFLTDEFTDLVPLISFSLIVSIAANLACLSNESTRIKSTGQFFVNLVGAFVAYRIFVVFPFDFSGYEFPWDTLARIVLIVAIVGSTIGAVAEAVKLVSNGSPSGSETP